MLKAVIPMHSYGTILVNAFNLALSDSNIWSDSANIKMNYLTINELEWNKLFSSLIRFIVPHVDSA